MPNPVIENVDVGQIAIDGADFHDELITFGGGGTLEAGTILARDSVSGKLVPFEIGGSDGADVPKAVLTYAVTAAGAGDVSSRVLVAGTVNQDRLIIDADGDGSNLTAAILDQLRSYGIVATPVNQLAKQDNQ